MLGPGVSYGLLHGRLSAEEKADALAAFAAGRTNVLIATTVVEVRVPLASQRALYLFMLPHAPCQGKRGLLDCLHAMWSNALWVSQGCNFKSYSATGSFAQYVCDDITGGPSAANKATTPHTQ